MRVMGVGGGAREHALTWKLSLSDHKPEIFWVAENRNPGIHKICKDNQGELRVGRTTDPKTIVRSARGWGIDIVVVGPEEPGFQGIPDALEKEGIQCIGASQELSIIERSKADLRRLQWENNLPGKLLFRTFKNPREASDYIRKNIETQPWLQNIVIKPARQSGGKGVKLIEDRQAYLHDDKQHFKEAYFNSLQASMASYADIADKILIEEKAWGPEYSLQCFTDGKTILGTPLVQDNKSAHEFDSGPETGGMGSISGPDVTLPFITGEEYDRSLKIVEGIVQAIQEKTGKSYHGMVGGQMMLTENEGPTIIEMYSRLGDPEALNMLAMLKTDIIDIFQAIVERRLSKLKLEFTNEDAVVVKVVAPNGYPEKRDKAKGHPVQVFETNIKRNGCYLFWGSADLQDDNQVVTGGSRLLALMAMDHTLPPASAKIEKTASSIQLTDGWGLYHRTDIGTEDLLKKRTNSAERVRRIYKYREEHGILGSRTEWVPRIGRVDPSQPLLEETHIEQKRPS
ncbi:MAG TPA: phosphoribosylamine--glycine ligase [Candidatus Bathyarchaeia archaeon]|nr:phosphoribosylamine--glycine ligase [Candidatus Bathyarchaeia archaeon]